MKIYINIHHEAEFVIFLVNYIFVVRYWLYKKIIEYTNQSLSPSVFRHRTPLADISSR